MKFSIIFILLFGAFHYASSQTLHQSDLKPGDLIFQNLDCGPMCDAIEAVTDGVDGQDFSHVAMICRQGDSLVVIEAIGKGVHYTSLSDFSKRTSNKMYVGRVKPKYKKMIADAEAFAERQINIPYDDAFLYDNGKYYCSELVYDAFKFANHNKPFFTLYPMTYKQPGSNEYFPVWVDYFNKIKIDIPEGKPGCNPGGLSRSDKIEIIGTL
jgi:cell wall-associated NlpC family hydrolase